MSETLTEIRIQFLDSRKARDTETSAFLSTIIGEIESGMKMIDGVKTVSEEDVVKILKSFEKKNAEFLAAVPGNEKSLKEKAIIESFLPKQLADHELHMILLRYYPKDGEWSMGAMMKFLKDNYAGQYDGKTASQEVKKILDVGPYHG